jgi:hypothetical protein
MIDIGRLSIQISTSHLHLRGSLCRLPGVTVPLNPEIVRSIFSELGRIQGIRRVGGDFDNWRQVDEAGSVWVPVDIRKMVVPGTETPAPGVFDVNDAGKPGHPG